MEGDEEGEYTYIGTRGKSVINYAIVNEQSWGNVKRFEIAERVESDHLPIVV